MLEHKLYSKTPIRIIPSVIIARGFFTKTLADCNKARKHTSFQNKKKNKNTNLRKEIYVYYIFFNDSTK